jgi:hypothetical protein
MFFNCLSLQGAFSLYGCMLRACNDSFCIFRKGRRNLSLYTRAKLAIELKSYFTEKGQENKVLAGKLYGEAHPKEPENYQLPDIPLDIVDDNLQEVLTTLSKPLPSTDPVNTRKELSIISGVSEGTISKVEKIEEKATEETKNLPEVKEKRIIKTSLQVTNVKWNKTSACAMSELVLFKPH